MIAITPDLSVPHAILRFKNQVQCTNKMQKHVRYTSRSWREGESSCHQGCRKKYLSLCIQFVLIRSGCNGIFSKFRCKMVRAKFLHHRNPSVVMTDRCCSILTRLSHFSQLMQADLWPFHRPDSFCLSVEWCPLNSTSMSDTLSCYCFTFAAFAFYAR